MKVEVQDINSCQKRLEVEIPREEVDKELNNIYKDLQKKVRVKGFRPGKVPRYILERLYKAEVENELISKLIPETYDRIIRENGIKAVGTPRVDEVRLDRDEPLRFSAVIEVLPDIPLEKYGGWEFIKKIPRVTEEQVERELENLRHLHAQWEAVDRPARQGDYVVINCQGYMQEKRIPELEAQNMEIVLGSNSSLPELESQLLGLSRGEEREIKVSFPKDYRIESLAGKEALLKVEVAEVKEKRLPELNDDFAREVQEEVENLEELRQHIIKNLEQYASTRADRLLHREIIDRILEENPFPVPESLIETELQRMLDNMEAQLRSQGLSLENPEVYKDNMRETAIRNIRTELILDKIQELEGITVSEEEVEQEVKRLAASMKKSEEFIRQTMAEGIRRQLVREKTLNLLVQKNSIREEIVDSLPQESF